jgi:hypothetical protein
MGIPELFGDCGGITGRGKGGKARTRQTTPHGLWVAALAFGLLAMTIFAARF